ncbi:MAG: hypothetical protein IT382_21245 [Deltaproteobacteria bacterium]|jgi:hypothetical protein|nr:hypothetical protein [Deltaproteobacteria bacterium]
MGLVAVAVAMVSMHGAAQAPVAPPPPTAQVAAPARRTVVILDDRTVKDQAPGPFLTRVADEIGRLRGMSVVRFSEARKRLTPKADLSLSGCGDDAGCLATASRAAGGDLVVTVRLTKREGASFLALTRVNALRPQVSEDSGNLSGSDAEAFAAVPEAVAELFPDAEAR